MTVLLKDEENFHASSLKMQVLKRGERAHEDFNEAKITSKLEYLKHHIYPLEVDVAFIVDQVKTRIHNNITTAEIDILCAEICEKAAIPIHPDYDILSARILINDLHKRTLTSFGDKIEVMYRRVNKRTGKCSPFILKDVRTFVQKYKSQIEAMIDYDRDYLLRTKSVHVLKKQFLIEIDGKIVERPQDRYMAVAINNVLGAQDTMTPKEMLEEIHLLYDLQSTQRFTFATPTLLNSSTVNGQLSSCFLLTCNDDMDIISKVLHDCAMISKHGGGVGINVNAIRSAEEPIYGTNGVSDGPRKFLQVAGKKAKSANQGGGKRNGSFAVFMRDHHPFLLEFITLRNHSLPEDMRADEIFTGVMFSDLFWETLEEDGTWHFIDPSVCPELSTATGERYKELYHQMVKKGKSKKNIKARQLYAQVITQHFETGLPYMLNIDHINAKNNLKHYAPVLSSNLCVEIMLPSSIYETAVCNLMALILIAFVTSNPSRGDISAMRKPRYRFEYDAENLVFDLSGLRAVSRVAARACDRVIDRNMYPVKEAMISNLLHRSIGIGKAGLADVACALRLPYRSPKMIELHRQIAETIHLGTLEESSMQARFLDKTGASVGYDVSRQIRQKQVCDEIFEEFNSFKKHVDLTERINKILRFANYDEKEYNKLLEERSKCSEDPRPEIAKLAKKLGVFPSYHYGDGAPISKGIFQWKMWGVDPETLTWKKEWQELEQHILRYGIRNSFTTAQMPTATVALIANCMESVEPFTYICYRRKLISGEIVARNEFFIRHMVRQKRWNQAMFDRLNAAGGSIRDFEDISPNVREIYEVSMDMGQKPQLLHAIAVGPFHDHSQSYNVFIPNTVPVEERANILFMNHYFAWKHGLKTGMYYLRTNPAVEAAKFGKELGVNEEEQTPVALVEQLTHEGGRNLVSLDGESCVACGV